MLTNEIALSCVNDTSTATTDACSRVGMQMNIGWYEELI
tara:strand:+ start:22 stop:138 length:117 start_codon:yes stop_codon:yes gene_type:complete